ncbi:MAG TPA: redoxin domain-containing protein [Aggregatilineales bacterium]|nr:redoxin domain-containing protein [Aggregatilineales bacterium]
MQSPEPSKSELTYTDADVAPAPGGGSSPRHGLNPILLLFLIFPVLGIVAAIVTGLTGRQSAGSAVPPPAYFTPTTLVGSLAPDFTLQTPDGGSVSLASLRGKWVFLNFWATWCGPCREEMPVFQQTLDGRFGDYKSQLAILGVDRAEDAGTVKAFLHGLKVSVPVGLDSDGQVNNSYGVLQLPETFVIDPSGKVRYWQVGEMTEDLTRQYLQKELGSSTTF